jgi:hypothetical protein
LTAAAVAAGSVCAPSPGSGITTSTTPSDRWSSAVIRIAAAAAGASSRDRHRIDEAPSGLITEYTEFSSASTASPTPIASAPPEPPSPRTTTTIGTCSPVISLMLDAIASAWPRSSAAGPGNAPAVSRNVTSGRPSLSASRIRRCALRKPSGCGDPKFRLMFDSVSVPF